VRDGKILFQVSHCNSQMVIPLLTCIRHCRTSGKHEGGLWASLGSSERPKDFKDTETIDLSGERYIFFQRHGDL
jgi:hypothetical protein